MKTCRDIMTENVTVCPPNASIVEAARMMRDENVGSIPVVEDENSRKLIGLITDRDIAIRVVAEGDDPKDAIVFHNMSKDLVTCRPGDDLETARQRMSEYQIRRLPIVSSDGNIVGIIAQADLALRTNEDEETEAVVEEISRPNGKSR